MGPLVQWHLDNCKYKNFIGDKNEVIAAIEARKQRNERLRVGYEKVKVQRPAVSCPHCGITAKYKKGGLNKWHFDNCKFKGLTEEEKEAIRNPKRPAPQESYSCPHCNFTCKTARGLVMYHNDRCKFKGLTEAEKNVIFAEQDAKAEATRKRKVAAAAKRAQKVKQSALTSEKYDTCPHCQTFSTKWHLGKWHYDKCVVKGLEGEAKENAIAKLASRRRRHADYARNKRQNADVQQCSERKPRAKPLPKSGYMRIAADGYTTMLYSDYVNELRRQLEIQ